MKNKSKYFSPREFELCNPPCTIDDIHPKLLALLDRIRDMAGIPLVMNCVYRSVEYDLAKGRSGESEHCEQPAMGVDIRCNTSVNRFKILKAAIICGVRRIGIGKTFIHIGIDESHPQNVIWHYYE
jgi:hypothetical protein